MRKIFSTHKMSYTKFYSIWNSMKVRCNNKKNKDYGGRGITVCKRWLKFENFRDDMYSSYKEHKLNNKHISLDRIDNNGNYCKKNCQWATRKEQQNNRRNNHLLTYKGQTLTISQWAKKLNIKRNNIDARIRINWSIKKILTAPINNYSFGNANPPKV